MLGGTAGGERGEQLLCHIKERASGGSECEALTRKYAGKCIPHKDSCSPNCFGILRRFPHTPVWVCEEPAELVIPPFLSLLEFVQRIFLH